MAVVSFCFVFFHCASLRSLYLRIKHSKFHANREQNRILQRDFGREVLLLSWLRFTSQVNHQPAIKILPCDSNPREASFSFSCINQSTVSRGWYGRVFNCLLMNNGFLLKQKAVFTFGAPCWTLIKRHKFLLIPAEKSTSCCYMRPVLRTCRRWCSTD